MDATFLTDLDSLPALLHQAQHAATAFLTELPQRPTAGQSLTLVPTALPEHGSGGPAALSEFLTTYAAGLSSSVGPRYLGFVTGGTTPAALAADWLVSAFDQNLMNGGDSVASHVERETIAMLQNLLGLPASFTGSFVSGATMSNFVSLALARQWVGQQHGVDVAQAGYAALPALTVLSAAPHSSVYKALAMLGIGRDSLQLIAALPGREAIDVAALESALQRLQGQPAIVVASAATINTADFDDLRALGELKQRYPFWLHVDAAFGAFAACSPKFAHLVAGIELADSVTADAHKWLNVPYDSAMQFTRPEHGSLQVDVFQNKASYLGAPNPATPDFNHLTPENSRRFRALPAWCTLRAYGRAGYRELVERNCESAQELGRLVAASPNFILLGPVHLNVVCFTLAFPAEDSTPGAAVERLLHWLRTDGRAFFSPTVYNGTPGLRAAFSNWRTTAADVALAWQALQEAAQATAHIAV